ncbi:MAG: Ig-like, group 2 [uncultured bacterium (gcode 4)]|uniref:Ig-like, group 2 n=1 Tax=uncultured bacterium (gcode 4) TaxID=1234023 RepID=K2G4P9_9BACT|nr:MAG: Ig-like, group 2 [uncultured bacterium (gcode 4)]
MENLAKKFQGTIVSLTIMILFSLLIILGNIAFAVNPPKAISWTVSLPAWEVAYSGGISVNINAHSTETAIAYTGIVNISEWDNSADYSIIVPANSADYGYEVSYWLQNLADPIVYSNLGYYSADGTVGGSKLSTLVDVSASDAAWINLTLLHGRMISWIISLPGTDVVSAWGMQIRIEVDSLSKWYMGSTYILASLGSHSGSYRIIVPVNASEPGYEVSYHLEGETGTGKYLKSAFYTPTGAVPSWDSASFVDISSADAAGIDMTILTWNLISGKISLPLGDVAPAWGIGVTMKALSSNGKITLAKTQSIIPAGSNSGSYSMIAPLNVGSGYAISYSLLAYASGYVDNAFYGSGWWTPDITSSSLVDISAADATGIDLSILTGNAISGTVSLPFWSTAPNWWIDGTVYVILPNGEDATWADFSIPKGRNSVNYSMTAPVGSWYRIYSWIYTNSVFSPAWYYSSSGTVADRNLASAFDSTNGESGLNMILIDSVAPVVTLNGLSSVKVNYGTAYFDGWAKYADNFEWIWVLSASWVVNTSVLWTYTLTYEKTDLSWNASNKVTRSVEVFATPAGSSWMVSWAAILTWSVASWDSLDVSGLVLDITSTWSDLASLSGTLTLSWISSITVSGSTWDWVLIPPTMLASGSLFNATLTELWNLVPQDTATTDYTNTVLLTFQVWGLGTSLWSGNSEFLIRVLVSSWSAWDLLRLYRSSDGSSWSANSPDSTCTLDSLKICSFRTDHLSYFAVVKTTSSVIPPVNNGWGGGGGSGGGGGWTPMDSCVNWDTSWSYTDGKCSKAEAKLTASSWSAQASAWVASVISFPDIGDSFAAEDIKYLAKNNIISGFSDWTFRPNASASRAEFLAMVIKSLWIPTSSGSVEFIDIPADWTWMIKYIAKAKELWIAKGQIIGWKPMFRPNDPITRAEAIAILLNAAKITTSANKIEFIDIPADWTWMIKYISKAKELWIATGQTIGWKLVFRPNDTITRAETARIITKTLGHLEDTFK